jgi:hypothetical protein
VIPVLAIGTAWLLLASAIARSPAPSAPPASAPPSPHKKHGARYPPRQPDAATTRSKS